MLAETQKTEEKIPIADALDKVILSIGKTVSWANLILIIVTILQVILRYGFNNGMVMLEELEWHLFSLAFMVGLSYALVTNSHVRVDVIQSRFSRRTREMIDLLGHIFLLLPFILVLMYYGWEFTESSYVLNERSNAPLGLPFRWLIKGVIPVSFFMLGIATISRIIRSFVVIRREKHGY